MTDIYIVRHGNTFDKGDIVTRVGARTDLPLSQSGKEQAEALAAHFRQIEPQGFLTGYCSPLIRTRETLDAILSTQKKRVEPEVLDFLREVDYGPDENQTEETVTKRIGELALKSWDEHAVPPPDWKLDPPQLKQDWADLFRALNFDRQAGPVLIVTSNGIARFALDAITKFQMNPASIKLKTGAYGLIHSCEQDITLVSWNIRP